MDAARFLLGVLVLTHAFTAGAIEPTAPASTSAAGPNTGSSEPAAQRATVVGPGSTAVTAQASGTSSDIAALRIDIRELKDAVAKIKPQGWWSTNIPIAVALITAFAALFTSARSAKKNVAMHKESLAEKSREEERAMILARINEFYGPFLQLRAASEYLYFEAFIPRRTPEERDKYKGQSGSYRTILALVDGYRFAGADATVLHLIVELGKKSADLIYTKIGLVDDPDLRQLLAQATTHYKLMEIAETDGTSLAGIGQVIDKFTFPHKLDDKVREKLAALEARLQDLRQTAPG